MEKDEKGRFTQGNQWWRKRSKHGRDRIIQDPQVLLESAYEYFEETSQRTWTKKDWVGKDAEHVCREKEKPLTFIGFQNYLDDQNVITDVTDYFENKDNRYSDFVRICSRIKRNIQQDQIEGGMANIYNPSITQRLNGLVDKTEQTTITKQPLFPDIEHNV